MKNKRIILITLLIILSFNSLQADNVLVRVFSTINISDLKIEQQTGRYIIAAGNEEFLLSTNNFAELTIRNAKVHLKLNGKDKGNYNHISFKAEDPGNILRLIPNQNKSQQREYEGNFNVKILGNALEIINNVDLEHYLAGVVQGEIYGRPDQIDIFKVQAVISRTWLLKNMEKHKTDGYNVCDGVHCQVYKNRCLKKEILRATEETHNEVMIDANGNLIETAFHSNSGGQTVNSEDFWQSPLPYLRSVSDTFSTTMKMAKWEKKMPKNDWLNYFKNNHGLDIRDKEIADQLLNYQQEERQTKICGVSLRKVREDLKFRSTFFCVSEDNNDVIISGKGFGHGVGLSQEGAIRMVELGIPYNEILTFYYTGAKLRKSDGSVVNTKTNEKETIVEEVTEGATNVIPEEIEPVKEVPSTSVDKEKTSRRDMERTRREKETSRRKSKKEQKETPVVIEKDSDFEIIID